MPVPKLEDFRPTVHPREGETTEVVSRGFWTCGVGCPHPRACLALEKCERGFVGNPVGFSGGCGLVQAFDDITIVSGQLTASHAALSKAIKPFNDTLNEEQYARRDGEWQKFFVDHDLRNQGHNSMVVAGMHDAFNAGWAARKRADYEMVFGLDTPRKA